MPIDLPRRVLTCLAWAFLCVIGRAQGPADALAGLRAEINALMDGGAAPGATWACQVVSAETGAVWFERDPGRLMVPASNAKLFTVAMALDRFGTQGTFGTEWRWKDVVDAAGTLPGDAWVVAGGDPAPGGGLAEPRALAGLVEALGKAGIRRIQGRIVLVDDFFDAPPFGPGWNWDDLPEAYGAPVTGFQWADNAVTLVVEPGSRPGAGATVRMLPISGAFEVDAHVRTAPSNGPARVAARRMAGADRVQFRVTGEVRLGHSHVERMAVPDAAGWFAMGLKAALKERGIDHGGVVVADRLLQEVSSIPTRARVASVPMGEIAVLCLKPSNNRIAQALWLHVGADARRHPRPGEAPPSQAAAMGASATDADDNDRAALALSRFMEKMGVPRGEVFLEEGSGLSRKNLVTPRATVRLLRGMDAGPAAMPWRAALPVGGVDGTLKSRFTDPAIKGRVVAKTGTLRHVHSLAGYITTAAGQRLAFALFVNGHASTDNAASGRAEVERIAARLAAFQGRGPQ